MAQQQRRPRARGISFVLRDAGGGSALRGGVESGGRERRGFLEFADVETRGGRRSRKWSEGDALEFSAEESLALGSEDFRGGRSGLRAGGRELTLASGLELLLADQDGNPIRRFFLSEAGRELLDRWAAMLPELLMTPDMRSAPDVRPQRGRRGGRRERPAAAEPAPPEAEYAAMAELSEEDAEKMVRGFMED